MRIREMYQGIKGKRVNIIKDSDAGTIKGFILSALTDKGLKAIRMMKKSISKKDVKGTIISEDPLVIEFGYSRGFSKQVGEKSTVQMIGLLMKGQGATQGVDYEFNVLRFVGGLN